jgi:transposase
MQLQNNKLSFQDQNIYTGIDVHKNSYKATIIVENRVFKTFSQPADPKILVEYLKRNFPDGNYYSAYEASFSGFWLHDYLNKMGIKNIVVNPADIPTTDKEKKQKEDKRDSKKIAKGLINNELVPIYVMGNQSLEDRKLLRMRQTIAKDLTRLKNRIKSDLYFFGIKFPPEFENSNTHWSKKFMKWLEEIKFEKESGNISFRVLLHHAKHLREEQLMMNREIRKLSNEDKYKDNVKLLISVPGIGLLTAMIILTELDDINRFQDLDNLCSYMGISPTTNSSGDNEKVGKITPRSNNFLRNAIIESSWIASRTDPALLRCYIDYIKRMDKNKAVIKIARKLINRIRFVLKNKKMYVYSIVR